MGSGVHPTSYLKMTTEVSVLSARKENLSRAECGRQGRRKKTAMSAEGGCNGTPRPWAYKKLSQGIKCSSEEIVEGFAALVVVMRLKFKSETVMHGYR